MLDIYGTLEIERVISEIRDYSLTEIGKNKLASLRMLPKEQCLLALNQVNEMTKFILKHGSLPISSSFDLTKYIELVNKGGVLTPLELDHVALDVLTAKKVADFFKKAEKDEFFYILKILKRRIYKRKLQNGKTSAQFYNVSGCCLSFFYYYFFS